MRLHFVDVLYFPSILHEIFHHLSIRFFVPTIILLLVFVLFCYVVVLIIALTIILCYMSCVYHCSTYIMWGLQSITNLLLFCCITSTYHHFYVVILAHAITHMLQILCMPLLLCFNFCVCHHSFCYISYTCHYSASIVWHSKKKELIYFCFITLLAPIIVFCFYILNPNLFQVILSLFCCYKMDFNWGVVNIVKVKKKFKVFFNQFSIIMIQMLLKKWLGMVMVGLYLNQLVNWLEEKN